MHKTGITVAVLRIDVDTGAYLRCRMRYLCVSCIFQLSFGLAKYRPTREKSVLAEVVVGIEASKSGARDRGG